MYGSRLAASTCLNCALVRLAPLCLVCTVGLLLRVWILVIVLEGICASTLALHSGLRWPCALLWGRMLVFARWL